MKLKTIAFALALSLASSVSALDIDRSTGGGFYVSSYSTAAMYYNMNAGEAINIYNYGPTNVFCGVATFSNPAGLLMADYVSMTPSSFTAPHKDLYLIVCIKSSGISGDNILVLENIVKRNSVENVINGSDSALLEQLIIEMVK